MDDSSIGTHRAESLAQRTPTAGRRFSADGPGRPVESIRLLDRRSELSAGPPPATLPSMKRSDQAEVLALIDPARPRRFLRLDHLVLCGSQTDAHRIRTTQAALVTALEQHESTTFSLIMHACPRALPEVGRIDVVLMLESDDGDERLDAVVEDLVDLLAVTPPLWSFDVVDAADVPAMLFEERASLHVAEVMRREAPSRAPAPSAVLGFAGPGSSDKPREAPSDSQRVHPWVTWSLSGADPFGRRLAETMLAQDDAVTIITTLSPSRLEADEIDALSELLEQCADQRLPRLEQLAMSRLEHFLDAWPLFDMRCLVASPSPLSRALLSVVGWTASPPVDPNGDAPLLTGGYAVERIPPDERGQVWPSPLTPISSLATKSLRRLRSLMGPWEASTLFRLPVANELVFAGIDVYPDPGLRPDALSLSSSGVLLGAVDHERGFQVRLPTTDRLRHQYMVGQPGTGKSTLMLNMILQDIEAGHGVAVLDPHGSLIDDVLGSMPDDRLGDVILVDPASGESAHGVNLLQVDSPAQREIVITELCSMAYDLFDPGHTGIVGPRFEAWTRYAAMLLMDAAPNKATLLDIPRVFTNQRLRDHLIERAVAESEDVFWGEVYALGSDASRAEFSAWFTSKFEPFRSSAPIRRFVGQARSSIDLSAVLDEERILLVDLGKGRLGAYNSALVGFIMFTQLWAQALARPPVGSPPFFLYADEFQNFTTANLPALLAEARKFGVGLVLANQYGGQVKPQVQRAVLGTTANRLLFRCGLEDAELAARTLGGAVQSQDVTLLPNHRAIASISPGGEPLAPMVLVPQAPPLINRDVAMQRRRDLWGQGPSTAEVDEEISERWAAII